MPRGFWRDLLCARACLRVRAPARRGLLLTLLLVPLALGLILAAQGPSLAADAGKAPPDVATVLRKLDDLYRSTGSIARLQITIVTPKATRSLTMRSWSKGKDKALIVIEAPARDAGTATLKVDKNLWNYFPRIARTVRIPPSMMQDSWMGSDLTNDDLVRETSLETDYIAKMAGRSKDPDGWLLQLEARPGVIGLWARIEYVVSDELLPLVSRSYDRRGRLARTMRFEEVKPLGGRKLPSKMVLIPELEPGRRTEMQYLELQLNAEVPDKTFSLQELERNR